MIWVSIQRVKDYRNTNVMKDNLFKIIPAKKLRDM